MGNKITKKEKFVIKKVAGKNVLIDEDMLNHPKIKKSTLVFSKAGQVIARDRKSRKTTALGRIVLNARKGQIVDHINRDQLDNRRSNLRFVSARQNMLNRILKNPNGVIGVSIIKKSKNTKNYCASFSAKKKKFYFLSPLTPSGLILAAMARDKFVIQNKEEDYAPLNFPIFKQQPFKRMLLNMDLYEMRKQAG